MTEDRKRMAENRRRRTENRILITGVDMITSFRDLDVYNESFQLVLEVYEMTKLFPRFEQYELGSQLRRASISVPANIAEGWAKRHFSKEFKHHLDISLGSCNEMYVHLSIVKALRYAKETVCLDLMNRYDSLSGKIYALRKAWRSY